MSKTQSLFNRQNIQGQYHENTLELYTSNQRDVKFQIWAWLQQILKKRFVTLSNNLTVDNFKFLTIRYEKGKYSFFFGCLIVIY